MKVCVVGNTRQTLKGLRRLVGEGYDVICVFGLPEEIAAKKVNFISLANFCLEHSIQLDTSNNWDNLLALELDLVICLGDSRIVPEKVINAHNIIGNHGAVLPGVQGGASLVWGRMLNNGKWGVSIMELDKAVDSGKILVTKEFSYEHDCTMEHFCETADDLTIDALFEYLDGDHEPKENARWNVRIARHTDSSFAVDILGAALAAGVNIYLPPRRPVDSILNPMWEDEFVESFKKANSFPYPGWTE